jgi:hypothetical protein
VITNGATLTGVGTISGSTTVRGTNSPGYGVGSFTNAGAFTLAAGAHTRIEIATNTTPGAGWDLLSVSGDTLTLGGALYPVLLGGYTPTNTARFVIMTNTASVAGAFGNLIDGRVRVYREDPSPSIIGTLRVGVSNNYVVLDGFKTGGAAPGTIMLIR